MKDLSNKAFQTRAIHAGERKKGAKYTPVATPIWPTSAFTYENMDDTDAVLGGAEEAVRAESRLRPPAPQRKGAAGAGAPADLN